VKDNHEKNLKKLEKMSETQLVSYALRQHMELSGIDKLIPAAEVALSRLPLKKHYRTLLRDAFLKIAEHHKAEKHFYEYVKSVRKVLHLAPGNEKAINDQIDGFYILLSNYGHEYIKKDFEYLEFVIRLLRLKYSKGQYSKKIHLQTQRILDQIQILKALAPEGVESKHTFQIKQLIEPFTLGLTEEQLEEFAEIYLPYMDKWLEEHEKKEKDK